MIKPSKHYSYQWSSGVFRAFRERYTRATDLFQTFTNISDETLILYLSHYPEKWEKFKKIVKLINNWLEAPNMIGFTKQTLSRLETMLKRNRLIYEKYSFLPLTSPEYCRIIEEDGFIGGKLRDSTES